MKKRNTLSHQRLKYSILYLSAMLLLGSGCATTNQRQLIDHVYVIKKDIRSPKDIVSINDSLVVPYIYTNTISLAKLPVSEKKQKFFAMMLPAVLVAKTNLDVTRKEVEALSKKKKLSSSDKDFLNRLMKKFKTSNIQELNIRMHTFPVSIVLAQAAIESGWGTSRFFLEGNNPFGIWSFDPKHNRIAASSTRDGTKVYLRKFSNLEQAIDAYYVMLATRQPFAAFRKAHLKTNNPDTLIQSLKMYSERRESYINELALLMRTSHLKDYDSCKLIPGYLRTKQRLNAGSF